MIHENQKTLNRLQIFLDLFTIPISLLLAYWFRFDVFNGTNNLTFGQTIFIVFVMMPIYFVLYCSSSMYSSRRTRSIISEIGVILSCNIIAALILTLLLYLFKIFHFSRYVIVLFAFFNCLTTVITRASIKIFLSAYRKKGYNKRFCLVIGTNTLSRKFIEKVREHDEWGYEITGVVAEKAHKEKNFWGISILGTIDCLADIFSQRYFDLIVLALTSDEYQNMQKIFPLCEKTGARIIIVPYFSSYIPSKPLVEDLDGMPVLDTRYVPLDHPLYQTTKRLFDIVFSLVALSVFSPVMIVAAILTKCTSKGPIFYKQERVGKDQKPFNMYKFRSMRVQTVEDGQTIWTTKDDPRKTKWGDFMRKTSIDELPQFFNILTGTMSVVGPRPERPYFVSQFKETIPRYMVKHQVRPGLTGWAQVNGWRGDTSIEKRIEHDLYYIENWSFLLDIKIIFLTVFKGFVNKNAY